MDIVNEFFFTAKYQTSKNLAALVGIACIASVVIKHLWMLKGGIMAYVLTILTRRNLKKYGAWAGKCLLFACSWNSSCLHVYIFLLFACS